MRSLTQWDPATATRWPGGLMHHPFFRASDTVMPSNWAPALDLTETPEAFEVTLELPGLNPEDIEVNYERGTLVVRGEKKSEHEEKDASWRRVERSYGAFSRAVRIAAPVRTDAIEARFHDGVLHIRLPKAEEAKKHQIQVSDGGQTDGGVVDAKE